MSEEDKREEKKASPDGPEKKESSPDPEPQASDSSEKKVSSQEKPQSSPSLEEGQGNGKKRLFMGVLVLFSGGVLIFLLLKGALPLFFDMPYKLSLKEFSDEIYSYPTEGPLVPLFDDYRLKTLTYTFPPVTLNLKDEKGQTSYGRFEFFFILKDEKTVSLIQKKESEILESLQKVFSEISWNDLQKVEGKVSVKEAIQDQINNDLGRDWVQGVYYRSILLKK